MYEYDYPRPAVSADVMVVDSNHDPLQLLLVKRLNDPFKNSWALPGGFMNIDETLESAAMRELKEETSLVVDDVQQIGAFSAIDRDVRTRVITFAFLATRPEGQTAVAADDALEADWFSIDKLPKLAFDHNEIIECGLKMLALNK